MLNPLPPSTLSSALAQSDLALASRIMLYVFWLLKFKYFSFMQEIYTVHLSNILSPSFTVHMTAYGYK